MLPYPDLPWKNETEFYNLHSKEIFSEFPFYHLSMVGNTKEEFLNYIRQIAECLSGEMPDPNPNCKFCNYRKLQV